MEFTRSSQAHAVVMRLHAVKTDVILTPEMVDSLWDLSSSSPSLSVGFSILDEAKNVTRSAKRGAHYHTDVIYFLP